MVMPINELAPSGRLRTVQQTMVFTNITTSSIDMFTIANGQIYVEMFIGRVTTAITSTNPVSIFHEFTPTTAALIALNTVLVITNDPIDTIYTCTGGLGAILAEEDNGLCLTPSFGTNHWSLGPGVMNLDLVETGGPATDISGVIEWSIVYQPLNALVTVVAM